MNDGKTLFKSVYNEQPAQFRTDFEAILKNRIEQKIELKKEEIVGELNGVEPVVETDTDTDSEDIETTDTADSEDEASEDEDSEDEDSEDDNEDEDNEE